MNNSPIPDISQQVREFANQLREAIAPAPWYERAYAAVYWFFRRAAFYGLFIVLIVIGAPLAGLINGLVDAVKYAREIE